jgi:hypothetical protein
MTGELQASPAAYAAAGTTDPPPPLMATPVPASGSTIDNLLAALGVAANVGVGGDNADTEAAQAERVRKTADAAAKFPANEEESAALLAAPDDSGQLAQQVPQLASGVAGAIAGVLGGALQPLSQAPQQAAQAGQQAMQMAMGKLARDVTTADVAPDETSDADDGLDDDPGALLGPGATPTLGGTAPTAMPGPAPAPSAATFPASSAATPAAAPTPAEPTTAARGGMGAMPVTGPGGIPGTGGPATETKPDTKRVVVPSVKNGAPVQGRITTPSPEVTKLLARNPITARRIVAPDEKPDDADPI